MRSLKELINTTEPGWDLVKQWIDSAKNKIEILPVDSASASKALYEIQVSTRSPMGAIIYGTGGILIDHGWIRILGSGSPEIKRSLPDWNKGKSIDGSGDSPPFLLVADDVLGGFFLLNGGGLGNDPGKMYYWSPDDFDIEPMDLTYSEFLLFCFNNDLGKYYEGYRWNGWKEEISKINGDQAIQILPPLWTKEGKDFSKHSRRAIPVEEMWSVRMQIRKQLQEKK